MVIAKCAFCGSEFDAESINPKFRRQGKLRKFCSRRCNNLARPKKQVPPPEYFLRPCGRCGKEFDSTPKRPTYDKPLVYCRSCGHKGRIEKAKQKFASYKTTIQCQTCGKEFTVAKRLLKSRKHSGKFCSLRCAYKGRKAHGHEFVPAEVGAKRSNEQGYIMVFQPDNFDAVRRRAEGAPHNERTSGWILEHRYVMSVIMGRALHSWESVHHKDGDRAHNDHSNLELWIKTQPTGVRLADVAEVYGAELVAARLRIQELETMLSHRSL